MNNDFNVITDNEALAIDLQLSNNQNLTLATIYCPNGNPNLTLFQSIIRQCHVCRRFQFEIRIFRLRQENTSGPMLKNIKKQLNLIYLNNDEHTHMDRSNGSTDLSDMALISPNLAKHDIQFQIGDNLGSDHVPIEVSIDATPHRNSFINHTKYKFD